MNLALLRPTASWKQVNEMQNANGAAVSDFGDSVLCYGGMDRTPFAVVPACKQKEYFYNQKYCRLEGFGFGCGFFVCFWSFARHTGFVAAGKMQIVVLVS